MMGLQFADHLVEHGARNLLLWLELHVGDAVVSQNLVVFARPKHLELQEPQLTTQVREIAHSTFEVRVETHYPALWVWLDLPGIRATYSRRFFHLLPGKPVTVTIRTAIPLSLPECEKRLQIMNLVDTWR
jgi:beta-mannosidase